MLVTVSDKKIGVDANSDGIIDYYNADVISAQDYYPFGQLMPGRQYGTKGRYLFNGKEQDPEAKGTGTQYDYGLRIYDPRLGKFLSVDPLAVKYPFYSPYAFAGNDVIRCIDLDGAEPTSKTEAWKDRKFRSKASSIDVYDKVNHQVFSAHLVNDPNTGKSWIVADDGQGQNKNFYLRNDNGSANSIEYYVENGRTYLHNGHFALFETQNQKEARFGKEIADGFGIALFGLAGGISAAFAAPVAAPIALKTFGGSAALRGVAGGADGLIQYAQNIPEYGAGFKNLSNINIASIGANIAAPGSAGILASSLMGNGLTTTLQGGYQGIGSKKADYSNMSVNAILSVGGGKLGNGLDKAFSKYLKAGEITSNAASNLISESVSGAAQKIVEMDKKY